MSISDEKFEKLIEESRSRRRDSDCTSVVTENFNSLGCEKLPIRKDRVDKEKTLDQDLSTRTSFFRTHCEDSPKRIVCQKNR